MAVYSLLITSFPTPAIMRSIFVSIFAVATVSRQSFSCGRWLWVGFCCYCFHWPRLIGVYLTVHELANHSHEPMGLIERGQVLMYKFILLSLLRLLGGNTAEELWHKCGDFGWGWPFDVQNTCHLTGRGPWRAPPTVDVIVVIIFWGVPLLLVME